MIFKEFEQSDNSEQPLIVAICTPLMSRVHQLRQAGEIAPSWMLQEALTDSTTQSILCVLITQLCSASGCVDYIFSITTSNQTVSRENTKSSATTRLWW